jgi:hypothetical protein
MAARKPAANEKARAYNLMRRYGITIPEYEEIKAVQEGRCPICRLARGVTAHLQVDHDHSLEGQVPARETVRGLLCGRDNNRLGWFEAKRDRILDYLDHPPAKGVLM